MQVIEISHPLKDHYLTIIRDKETDFENFREYSSKLSYLIGLYVFLIRLFLSQPRRFF